MATVKVGDKVKVEVEATVHSVINPFVDKTGQGKSVAGGIVLVVDAQKINQPLVVEAPVEAPVEVVPE